MISDDFLKIVIISTGGGWFPAKNGEKSAKEALAEKGVFFTKCQKSGVFGDNLYFRNHPSRIGSLRS
jgi:hypothetical protein